MHRIVAVLVAFGGLLWIAGCGGAGQPSPENSTEGVQESGLQALPPGIEQESAQQAMQQFYETGQVSPELRKKLEQGEQGAYGGQYPGAQRGAPPGQQ